MIELVIYIALFVVLSAVVIQSLIFTMKTYATARAYRTLQQNGELVMERMTREIRKSNAVSTGGSVLGSSPGTLAISGVDSTTDLPYTETFSVVNGVVQLVVDADVASSLSSAEVTVSNLTFWNVTTTNTRAVKVQMTIATTKAPIVTSTFYTTVILRN